MDVGLLLLIVFILAPLLERLLALGRPKQPPQQGQPQQRAPQRRPVRLPPGEQEERPFRTIPPAEADAGTSAAEMLPDDLWEILTGERRAPRPAAPAPSQTGVETEARPPLDEESRPPLGAQPGPPVTRPRTVDRRRSEVPARPRPQRDRGEQRPRRPETPPRERRLPEVSMRRDPVQGGFGRPPARPAASPPDDYVREIPAREAPVVVSFDQPPLDAEERRAQFQARRAQLSAAATVDRGPGAAVRIGGVDDLRRAFIMAEILGPPRSLQD